MKDAEGEKIDVVPVVACFVTGFVLSLFMLMLPALLITFALMVLFHFLMKWQCALRGEKVEWLNFANYGMANDAVQNNTAINDAVTDNPVTKDAALITFPDVAGAEAASNGSGSVTSYIGPVAVCFLLWGFYLIYPDAILSGLMRIVLRACFVALQIFGKG